ncbi:hypothetical protein CYLTODRAFT_418200 [Cylindrobasidium torrendii FP15055 ss-10]|uniref:Uncharacterized protein n=1 Tax=Cylindrobasidium torrendii FP15055 ss-10 TaxID=1314674 RepID=A0A0D7BRJ5_9AGAR|nr:hypothetical protein CYLTODRAFT_418200 [Cylindrobasidium torrendii FP15055 ss-10]
MSSVNDLLRDCNLPRPDPYLIGFRLTYFQTRLLAERHCTPFELKRVCGAYTVALDAFAEERNLQQTFVPLCLEGVHCTFWAIGVVAVWKGYPHPKWRVPEVPKDYLCLPERLEEFGEFPSGTMRWPKVWEPPKWFYPMFMQNARLSLEHRKKQLAEKRKENAVKIHTRNAHTTTVILDSAMITPDASTTPPDASISTPTTDYAHSTHDIPFIVQSMRFMP